MTYQLNGAMACFAVEFFCVLCGFSFLFLRYSIFNTTIHAMGLIMTVLFVFDTVSLKLRRG